MGDELSDLQERLFAEGKARRHPAACCSCCRAWTPRARAACCGTPSACRPAGRAHHLVQGADRGGARPRLPVADRQGAAQPRLRRRLRPLALRGRADRPGARARPPEEIERRYDAINDFEERLVDAGTVVAQVHAAHLRRRAAASGCWPGWTTRRSTGSSTPATSTSAACGRPTRRPTRSPWSAPTPSTRRGTWSRRTRSGSATSPIGSLLLRRRCATWTRSGRTPTSTSRTSRRGCVDEAPIA